MVGSLQLLDPKSQNIPGMCRTLLFLELRILEPPSRVLHTQFSADLVLEALFVHWKLQINRKCVSKIIGL